MSRTIQQQLVDKGLAKKHQEEQKQTKKNNKKMSKREIEELMGIKRPTYKRNRGALRQQ